MRRYYLSLAVLILLVAAILRLGSLHSYPPGPHYDEAANLLIARSIAFGGARFFPIVEAYQGREVLYYYLAAPLLPLIGDRMYTLHLVSAFANLITIAAAIRLAREMFRGERGVIVALVVGLVATISFPQIFIARQAFRAVTLPLMQALALCFLWRGLRRRENWGWLVLGGIFAGGALYTYMASRLFPAWLAMGGLALLAFDHRHWRLRLRQGAVFFAVLVVTAIPIIVYALQKPDLFWGRLGEVTLPGQSISLLESVTLHLRMFFIQGDPYLRYNIPARPYFTWPEGILLVIGLGVAIWRVMRGRHATERTAYFLALLAPLMVIPSVVSVSGLPPSHMRSIAMIPLILVLIGVGFEFGLEILRRVVSISPRALAAVLLFTLIGSAALVGQTYFSWAGRADLYYETDADLSAAARWLQTQPVDNTRVYLAARDRTHPTVLIEHTPPITWLGTDTLYRAPDALEGLYIFPRSAPPPDDWAAWLEAGRLDNLPLGPDGRTAFEAFRLPGDTPLPSASQVAPDDARNAWISLVAFYSDAIESGGSGEIVTGWQIEQTPDVADLTPLVQIETADGVVLSRGDIYMTDTDRWEPGAVLFVRVPIDIPAATTPGGYPVRIAWVGRVSDTYVPYLKDNSGQAGIWALAGEVQVLGATQPVNPALLPITSRLDLDIAPGVRLLGFSPPAATVRPGESMRLTFYWQAVPTSEQRPSVRVEPVLRGVDHDYDLKDHFVFDTIYSPWRWRDGEVLAEYLHWEIERTQPAGDYQLYALINDHEVLISTVQIEGVARLYDMPAFDIPVGAEFDSAIRFVGYSLDTTNGLKLRLVWQAMQVMEQDYTVFVHLLDDDKNIVTQQDAMPVDNTYPTSLWQSGEYIVDDYEFPDLDANGLSIELGWYLQATGDRLSVTSPATDEAHDTLTLPD